MDFEKFGDLKKKLGFRDDEPFTPFFILNKTDLEDPVFQRGRRYNKVAGCYRITNIFPQENEVAFLAQESGSKTNYFYFDKEEVDFLAKKDKFRKG